MKKNYGIEILNTFFRFKESQPDKVAVVDCSGKHRTTYSELIKTVNSIAKYLKNNNIKPGDIVWIELGRKMENYASRLACNFIGAAFISVNPDYPQSRKITIWSEVNPNFKIDEECLSKILMGEYECQINENIKDEELGYLVFTSGTTGNPKGIVHDRSIYELIYNGRHSLIYRIYQIFLSLRHEDYIVGSVTDTMFILSMIDIAFLCFGKTIHIINEDIIESPNLLKDYFEAEKITLTFIIPALLKMILPLPSLSIAVILGESNSFDFKKCGTQIINFYGASEVPIMSFEHTMFGNVVGRTFNHSKIYLTKKNKGKVVFTGPSIMKGYLNNPEETNKVLSYDKKTKYRIFYSQDIGSYTRFHKIKLTGRSDSTVKIHGKRIDKAEVETNIAQIKDVSEAAVVDFGEEGNKYLVAFYTSNSNKKLNKNYLIDELRNTLPEYMIPSKFNQVTFFPRNTHGKIDRSLLKDNDTKIHAKYVTPKNDVEKILCKSFAKAFGVKKIGIDDDFILLGGDSLMAMKIIAMVPDLDITGNDLFTLRTPRKLAKQNKTKSSYNFIHQKKQKTYPLNNSANFVYWRTKGMTEDQYKSICNFNLCNVLKLKLASEKRIKESVKNLLDNHLLLKATVAENNGKGYFVRRDDWYPNIETIKLSAKPDANFFKSITKPFDLFNDNLFRCKLFRYKKDLYLYIDMHHIISDGYSLFIILEDIRDMYLQKQVAREKLNSFDLILALNDIYNNNRKRDMDYFNNIIGNNKFTMFPLSKKPDLPKTPIYNSYIEKISKTKMQILSNNTNTSISTLFFSAFIFALRSFTKDKKILIWFFTNGRNIDIKDGNNVACLYREYPFAYTYNNENNILEIAEKITKQKLESQTHIFSNFDYPDTINAHNIVFNYVANEMNDEYFEKVEKSKFYELIKVNPEKYCNNHIELDIIDIDSKSYGIKVDYNASMYSNNDMQKLVKLMCGEISKN